MTEKMTDAELLALVQQENDEKAFAIIVFRYNVTVYKYIYARVRSEHDAKDILQEVLISCWNNRASIKKPERILAYMMRAAHYSVIDWQINNKKVLARQGILLEKDEPSTFPAEEQLMAMELREKVDIEVAKMNDTMRKVFISSRWESKSIREIAEEYGLSEQTVKNTISLAMKRIKLRLQTDQWLPLYILLILSLQFLNGTTWLF
jgi:RNA polymerase sigma factor (sigma-70 family)